MQSAIAQQDAVRQPQRFAGEIAAFAAADREREGAGDCAIVFLGSSSFRLWRTLEKDMSPAAVVNRGFGGATIGDVNDYFQILLNHRTPRAIFFYAGENDIAEGRAPAEVVATFRRFLDLKDLALAETPVYFISIKPSPSRFSQLAAQRKVNHSIRKLARARRDLSYVEVASLMMANGRPRDIYVDDDLHMSSDGYAIWTRVLYPLVMNEARRSHATCPAQGP